ncbi:hypothetical protein DPMN_050366 [Dreissena polymorpha]|uniref:Uncharacterized protein n=1 Tax=Dreissena polymorpha TaxID=45954 RepID=A0A9D4CH29_DREPO|nr:hypothetical protein DPMN_050366 [Dreissena polymorpha]
MYIVPVRTRCSFCFCFNSSNLHERSSKSTSSPPEELSPGIRQDHVGHCREFWQTVLYPPPPSDRRNI